MERLWLPIDVMLFELRRSMSVGRIAVWCLLVAFPVAIITAMTAIARMNMGEDFSSQRIVEPFGMALYYLVPEVTCLLGLLLWATPAVSTEIEGQTWVYITMRTAGRKMVLLGKYITALVWTLSASLLSVAICSLVIGPSVAWHMWWVLSLLVVLSCISHGALYILIGVVFYRRTMVAAVFYTVLIEFGVSFIPALVNKFTINYRLRGLLANWTEWEDARSIAETLFGTETSTIHIVVLVISTIALLSIALWRVERTEYPTFQEG